MVEKSKQWYDNVIVGWPIDLTMQSAQECRETAIERHSHLPTVRSLSCQPRAPHDANTTQIRHNLHGHGQAE